MPKGMGKYKWLEVFYLSKPVYAADKPSDCHYCYYWTNGRKGCRLGRNNCYYLISLPPKPKSECDGCPYGRDHPCIGWCTKKVMREVGLRWYKCVWTGIPLLLFCPMSLRKDGYDFPQHTADNRKFSAERRWWSRVSLIILRSAIWSIHILSSSEGVVHEREVLEYFCRCQDAVWHFAWPHEPVCKEWLDR